MKDIIKLHEMVLILILISLCVIFTIMSPNFLSISNILQVSRQSAELGIIALGMSVVLITKGIDLSVGSIAALTACSLGFLLISGVNPLLSIFIALIVSIILGAFNGTLVALVGLPPILVTLGTMTLFNGIALALTKGNAFSNFPDAFYMIGHGSLVGIPIPTIIFLLLAIFVGLLLSRTRFGLSIYALGINEEASIFNGLKTKKMLLSVYILSGVLSGTAGVIMASRISTARADLGESYLLMSVAVAVLGGIEITGGKGKILGTVLATLIFAVLANGLNLIDVSTFLQMIITGSVLIFVLLLGVIIPMWDKYNFAAIIMPKK